MPFLNRVYIEVISVSLYNIVSVHRAADPRMKRNESVKSLQQFRGGRHEKPGVALGWRQNSLTISAFAQHSAYLAEKARTKEALVHIFVCFVCIRYVGITLVVKRVRSDLQKRDSILPNLDAPHSIFV